MLIKTVAQIKKLLRNRVDRQTDAQNRFSFFYSEARTLKKVDTMMAGISAEKGSVFF